MRPTSAAAALLLSLSLVPASTPAADLAAASRIDAVTVYRSGARVTRTARVALPPGGTRVLLAGLPAELDDDSIRAAGKGTGRARILGVAVEPVTGEGAADAAARAAEERVDGLLADDRALEDRIRVAQARAKFVESLRSTYSEERARNLAVRPVDAREWASLAAFVEAELGQAAAAQRKAEVARRDLARRLEAARAELDRLRAKRGETTKTVAIEVAADAGGAFDVSVSYVVPSAAWQPIWDARLLVDERKVELGLRASVAQSTGEDWKDVRLSLSTAQPSRSLGVPRLEPRCLGRAAPPPFLARAEARAARALAKGEAASPAAAPAEADAVELEEPGAAVERGLLAATFTTPRRETVDGAGQGRRVELARWPIAARIARTAAPRVDPAAFLGAKLVNDTGVPLPAGTAGVWIGDEFVGRAPLAATPPGGELELAFGADDRIEVDRRVLERRHETAGLVSKDEVWRYRVRISVKNRHGAPAVVTLLDLLPVSRDEAVRVTPLDGSTPATREDPERPGVRAWELALAPGAEQVVELRYEVRYPRGFPIEGLE